MKKPINLRISKKNLAKLNQLAIKTRMSRTQLIENAITEYYQKIYAKDNPLLKYAGILADTDFDPEEFNKMLKRERVNKNMDHLFDST